MSNEDTEGHIGKGLGAKVGEAGDDAEGHAKRATARIDEAGDDAEGHGKRATPRTDEAGDDDTEGHLGGAATKK